MKKFLALLAILLVLLSFCACNFSEEIQIINSDPNNNFSWTDEEYSINFNIDSEGCFTFKAPDGFRLSLIRFDYRLIEFNDTDKIKVFSGKIFEGTHTFYCEFTSDSSVIIGKTYKLNFKTDIDYDTSAIVNGDSHMVIPKPDAPILTVTSDYISWATKPELNYDLYLNGDIVSESLLITDENTCYFNISDLNNGNYVFYATSNMEEVYSDYSDKIKLSVQSLVPDYDLTDGKIVFSEEVSYSIFLNGELLDCNGELAFGDYILSGKNFYSDSTGYVINKWEEVFTYKYPDNEFNNGSLVISNDESMSENIIEIYYNGVYLKTVQDSLDIEQVEYQPGEYSILIKAYGNNSTFYSEVQYTYCKLPQVEKPALSYDAETDELTVNFTTDGKLHVIIDEEEKVYNCVGETIKISMNSEIGLHSLSAYFVADGYKDSERVYLEYVKRIKLPDIDNLIFNLDSESNYFTIEFDNLGKGVLLYEFRFTDNLSGEFVNAYSSLPFFNLEINELYSAMIDEVYDYTITVSVFTTEEYYDAGNSYSVTFHRERLQNINLTKSENILSWNSIENSDYYRIYIYFDNAVYDVFDTNEVTIDTENLDLENGTYSVQVEAVDESGEYASSLSQIIEFEIFRINYITPSLPAGLGTQQQPYIVKTPQELYYMSVDKDGCYIIANDIDLSGYEWVPVGDEQTPFTGKLYCSDDLQGNYFIIENLTINYCISNYIGLFGVYAGMDITGLSIINANINITESSAESICVGIFAGKIAGNVNIIDNIITGDIFAGETYCIGGFAGEMDYETVLTEKHEITRCVLNVGIEVAQTDFAGGVIGRVYNFSDGTVNYLTINYNILYSGINSDAVLGEYKEITCGWSYPFKNFNFISQEFYGTDSESQTNQTVIIDVSNTQHSAFIYLIENGIFVYSDNYNPVCVKLGYEIV